MEDSIVQFKSPFYNEGVIPEPVKAGSMLPRWFKELMPDIPDTPKDQFPVGTAKRCMPILDVFSAGYIIPLPFATHVYANEQGEISFNWMVDNTAAVESHSPAQVDGSGVVPYKWVNPWQVITPPGVSCLFIQPVNRPELPFECFSGIVDTDSYKNTVNFPFHWKHIPFDDVLDQGTPMIQVIPFRREDWSHTVDYLNEEGTQALSQEGQKVKAKHRMYKALSHHKKKW